MLTLNLRLAAFTRLPRLMDERARNASQFLSSPFELLHVWPVVNGFSALQRGDSNERHCSRAYLFDRSRLDTRSRTDSLLLTPSTAGGDGDDLLRNHLKRFFTADGLSQLAFDGTTPGGDASDACQAGRSADVVRFAKSVTEPSRDVTEALLDAGPD